MATKSKAPTDTDNYLRALDRTVSILFKEPDLAEIWSETPVSFREFVESVEHQGLPVLSEKQYSEIEKIIGKDPTKTFEEGRTIQLGVYMWGKGSGKDYISSILMAYLVHVLLCMHDPLSYLNPVDDAEGKVVIGEDLDIINVAYSEDQAKKIFFQKLKARFKHWKWLLRKFTVLDDGKPINDRGKPIVKITDKQITIPVLRPDPLSGKVKEMYYIRAISQHSKNESYEGHNIIAWIMDEAAAFTNDAGQSNAHAVYSTLRSSAQSRFPGRWFGFCLSYPRHQEDFIMEMYEIALKEKSMHGSKYAPWEVNPTKKIEDFAAELRLEPEEYRKKYLCDPPKVVDAFFQQPERITECVNNNLIPIIKTEEQLLEHKVMNPETKLPEFKRFIGRTIMEFGKIGLVEKGIPRVIHIDSSLSSDRTCMIIAHGEPFEIQMHDQEKGIHGVMVNKVIMDAIIWWEPDPTRELLVSLNSVDAMVFEFISQGFQLAKMSYDQWNSAHAVESLQAAGVFVEKHNINTEDYTGLRTMLYAGAAEIMNDALLIYELEHLLVIKDKKVDHPKEAFHHFGRHGGKQKKEKGSKDGADCLAGVNRLLNAHDEPTHAIEDGTSMFPRSVGTQSMHNMPVVKDAALRGDPVGVRSGNTGSNRMSPQAVQAMASQGKMSIVGRTGTALSPMRGPGAAPPAIIRGRKQTVITPRAFPRSIPGPS